MKNNVILNKIHAKFLVNQQSSCKMIGIWKSVLFKIFMNILDLYYKSLSLAYFLALTLRRYVASKAEVKCLIGRKKLFNFNLVGIK
jgi:hypothetical protein